ncbi:helix-turn-helix domain-containing protein [Paenibacillus sinopodophylli]|uniref:helix-turn-helix domain-containing protein n=1 Tax=Paenibacillus sinopodophylli TaxID=1837342 RepID=UPI00110CA294|nr:helix-turn-helix domain-containing protein [Paenibacillus sinopodophylli]
MKNKWFQKMMFSYLPLFFIMISILVFIFFLSVNQIAEKENKRANEQFAKQIMQLLDNEMYTLSQSFLSDVYFTDEVQLFFNSFYKDDIALNYELIQKLQAFVRSSEFIDSIYLYRNSDSMVLSDTIKIEATLYPDMDFALKESGEMTWSNARSFTEFDDSGKRRVVSSKKPYPLTGTPQGGLVMNVNLQALQKRFSELGRVDLSYAYVKDDADQWLVGNLSQQDSEQQEQDVVLRSETTGWTLYSGLNEHYLFTSLQLISRIWIVTGIFIILAGFAWLIYLIKRNYRPVEALAAQIESYSLRKSMELRGNYDEFKFIENALNTLLEDAQSHHKQLKESLLYKEKFLFQALADGSPSFASHELLQALAAKGFDPQASEWRFVLVEMDQFRDFETNYSRKDQLLLKFALTSVLKETADQQQIVLWAEWMSDKQVGVLVQASSAEEHAVRLHALYEECLKWVETHLSFTITIAEGIRVASLDEVYLSYDSTLEIMRFKPTIGSNQWLDETQINQITGVGYYQLLPEVHQLTESFRVGKASWSANLEAVSESIQDHHMSRKEIVNLFEYMLHKINSELSEVADAKGSFWSKRNIADIQKAIDTFDTVEELVSRVNALLSDVFARMLSWRDSNSNHALLDQAKQYIEKYYADAALSLNQISEGFGMNPANFSRSFKQGTGEKFVDYVTRIRIEHAKQKLIATDDSIQDIGFAVGYVHAVSFNRSFKKSAGITPGDYRKQYQG